MPMLHAMGWHTLAMPRLHTRTLIEAMTIERALVIFILVVLLIVVLREAGML
jgi:hypothetical protein